MVGNKDGGLIKIKTKSTADSVVLEISDDGPGMDSKLITRIFDPFFTTKKPGQGTGLGLSICFGIVQQHHGEMWATSQVGVGSSFFVQLPISTLSLTSSDDLVDDLGANQATSKGSLLIIDDEDEIRQLLDKGLKDEFESIDHANGGIMALEMIRRTNYDCILLDLKMPDISGVEVFENLVKENSQIAERIIIMTGDNTSLETASFISEMYKNVLNKPYTLDDIRQSIKAVREAR